MRSRVGLRLIVLLLASAAVAGWWLFGGGDAAGNAEILVTRESELGAPLTSAGCLALSPDGSRVAFITSVDGRGMLAIAPLGSAAGAQTAVIPGSEDARHPAWSRDGTRIAFATHERGPLKVVDVGSHAVRTIAPSAHGSAAWGRDDTLLFTGPDRALHRVDTAGRATRVTSLDPSDNVSEHAWPAFLPDGRRFLYLARASRPSDSRVYLSSLDSPYERRMIAEAHSAPQYADGHLLFIYEGILMAQPLDADSGRIRGVALPLAVGLQWDEWTGEGAVSANGRGELAFRLARTPPTQLSWFGIDSMDAEPLAGISDVHQARRSPDGTRIAATARDPRTGMDDIWIIGRDRGNPQRLTRHPSSDNSPVWIYDGSGVVFRSNRSGVYNLYRLDLPAEGGRPEGGTEARERRILESNVDDQPTDISARGDLLLFNRWSMDTRQDIWALPLGGGDAYAVLETEFLETDASFSPDGRWIAYETNASGASQVHVRRFPVDQQTIQISVNSGHRPRWTKDGRTIVYVRDDNRFEAVDLRETNGTIMPSAPRPLFITRPRIEELGGFDIDGEGRRILAPAPGPLGTPEPAITIIRGWTRLLRDH